MARITTESIDSGSNYSFGDKMQKPQFASSAFNLSNLVSTTIDNCGQLQVIKVLRTLPGDDWEISIRSLLRALPQVVPLYSRQRVYTYAFYSRVTDLYDEGEVFFTKGYTGDEVKSLPVLSKDYNLGDGDSDTVVAGSLADSMGIPQGIPSDMLQGLCALPPMMLFRVIRDYFTNKNYYINDRVLLPNDDSRFRLNSDGELLSAKDAGVDFKFIMCSPDFDGYQVDSDTGARTFTQALHDWPQDYFTSALPWPQRGTPMKLDVDIENKSRILLEHVAGNQYLSLLEGDNGQTGAGLIQGNSLLFTDSKDGVIDDVNLYTTLGPSRQFGIGPEDGYFKDHFRAPYGNIGANVNTHNKLTPLSVEFSGASISLTLNQLRELAINQTELEKVARTDGSFAEWGLTFFGEKSKNASNYKPYYIGGTYDNIQYTEVLQTSAQYAVESGEVSPIGSPLGTYAGHGIQANKGFIGKCHCDEHGYIMILACVMPDVYYCNGLNRMWTDVNQSDLFIPERAKLGLRPILNKELFYSGNESQDNNIWAWQNPFDEFRYEPNTITGKIADKNAENFYVYTQARILDSLVNYGQEFAEARNVSKAYLQATDEVAFTAQFGFDIRVVRHLPYKPIPANIIN